MFIRQSIKQNKTDEWTDITMAEMSEIDIKLFVKYASEATIKAIEERIKDQFNQQLQSTIDTATGPVVNMVNALNEVLGE